MVPAYHAEHMTVFGVIRVCHDERNISTLPSDAADGDITLATSERHRVLLVDQYRALLACTPTIVPGAEDVHFSLTSINVCADVQTLQPADCGVCAAVNLDAPNFGMLRSDSAAVYPAEDRRHPLRLRRPDREQHAAHRAPGGDGAAHLPRVVRRLPLSGARGCPCSGVWSLGPIPGGMGNVEPIAEVCCAYPLSGGNAQEDEAPSCWDDGTVLGLRET